MARVQGVDARICTWDKTPPRLEYLVEQTVVMASVGATILVV